MTEPVHKIWRLSHQRTAKASEYVASFVADPCLGPKVAQLVLKVWIMYLQVRVIDSNATEQYHI